MRLICPKIGIRKQASRSKLEEANHKRQITKSKKNRQINLKEYNDKQKTTNSPAPQQDVNPNLQLQAG